MTTKYEAPFHRTIQTIYINKEQPVRAVWGNYGILWLLYEIPTYIDPQNAECLSAAPGGIKVKPNVRKLHKPNGMI